MTNKKQSTWGGRREGSGRSPSPIRRTTISAFVTEEEKNKLEHLAKNANTSVSRYVGAIIANNLAEQQPSCSENPNN